MRRPGGAEGRCACRVKCFSPRTVVIGRYRDRVPTPVHLEPNQRCQMPMVQIGICISRTENNAWECKAWLEP